MHVEHDEEEPTVNPNYANPALDAELAYRREMALLAGRTTRTRRSRRSWLRRAK